MDTVTVTDGENIKINDISMRGKQFGEVHNMPTYRRPLL